MKRLTPIARCSRRARAARARRAGRRRRPLHPGRRRRPRLRRRCSRTRTPTSTFAPGSPAPYLSQTLPSQGAFIPEYYGVTHLSLGNYTGFVSGQGSNPQTQADCQIFTEFVGGLIGPDGQALGDGCVFPVDGEDGRRPAQRARADVEGLHGGHGQRPNPRERAVRTPGPEHAATTRRPRRDEDQYATRHNPFVYFHSIIDDNYACEQHVVPLTRLPADLAKARNDRRASASSRPTSATTATTSRARTASRAAW